MRARMRLVELLSPRRHLTRPERVGIARAQGYRCHYGGGPLRNGDGLGFVWEIDHKVARSRGGCDELHNLVASCVRHNTMKNTQDYDHFRDVLRRNPRLRDCGNRYTGRRYW